MQSGLLSSMAMTIFFTSSHFSSSLQPAMTSSVRSSMVRWSLVMYPSHSAPLMMTSWILEVSFTSSLTDVGKVAPPRPTTPLLRTAAMKLS